MEKQKIQWTFWKKIIPCKYIFQLILLFVLGLDVFPSFLSTGSASRRVGIHLFIHFFVSKDLNWNAYISASLSPIVLIVKTYAYRAMLHSYNLQNSSQEAPGVLYNPIKDIKVICNIDNLKGVLGLWNSIVKSFCSYFIGK